MNCYLCGWKIPPDQRRLRRRVQTGDGVIRRGKTGRFSDRNFTFGMRVVCSSCARSQDRRRDWDQLVRNLGMLGLLVLLALYLLLTQK
jgi:predicted nucleic acid-binding Zn ribbon protein